MIYSFFSLRAQSSTTDEEKAKCVESLRSLKAIPAVETLMVGILEHTDVGPTYGGVVVFRDASAYLDYAVHPLHLACIHYTVPRAVPGEGPGYDLADDPAELDELRAVKERVLGAIEDVDPVAAQMLLAYHGSKSESR